MKKKNCFLYFFLFEFRKKEKTFSEFVLIFTLYWSLKKLNKCEKTKNCRKRNTIEKKKFFSFQIFFLKLKQKLFLFQRAICISLCSFKMKQSVNTECFTFGRYKKKFTYTKQYKFVLFWRSKYWK
jgi:hypothetical protein